MDEISLTKTQRAEGKFLVIMRGIPGSGKSYEARKVAERFGVDSSHIFSTDDYWVKDLRESYQKAREAGNAAPYEWVDEAFYAELEKEEYRKNWCMEKIGKAHGWNQWRVTEAVNQGISPVIIDNTNIKARDCRFYVELAVNNDYTVLIQEPTSQWWQDHAHMFEDKQANGSALEDFARFLAGFHQGMEAKYGAKGNTHGVPLDTIRGMIRRWQPNLTVADILGDKE